MNKIMLIVDDLEINRAILKEYFYEDYQIVEAENGEEAYEKLNTYEVGIIVTDIFMPVMDGYELIKKVRQDSRYSLIPIIAITENNESVMQKILDAGANDFVTKPFVSNLVCSRVKGIMSAVELGITNVRKKYEEKLQLQSQLNKSIYNSVTCGIIKCSPQRGYPILYANKIANIALGIDDEKIANQRIDYLQFILPEFYDTLSDTDSILMSSPMGELVTYEYKIVNTHGKEMWIRDISQIIIGDSGQKEMLCILSDISEEKDKIAKEELNRVNELRIDFLARMSHDMRTPMNAILGLSDVCIREAADKDKMLDCMKKIYSSGEYLLSLINDVLDVSNIEKGKLKLVNEAQNIAVMLDNIAQYMRPVAESKNISLTIDNKIEDKSIFVDIDKNRFNQIFINLLTNAVKFTDAGGSIKFEISNVSKSSDKVVNRFSVRDNGIGISREFLKRIYVPFEQEGHVDSYQNDGSGLGMTIVKNIVDVMKGTIEINSEKGVGTEVIVEIPSNITHNPEVEEKQELVTFEGKNILVCEDHPLNMELVVMLLSNIKCNVIKAEDGKIAAQLFESSEEGYIDCVLMDIRMPNMDGLEATRYIRHLNRTDAKTVPIIAMTANAFDEDVKKSIEAGMNEHLSKPIDIDVLYETLAKYLK